MSNEFFIYGCGEDTLLEEKAVERGELGRRS
jgi:hypothetical protein